VTTLPAASRTKLAKVLALLGSDRPGERDAAALAAHRLVVGSGLTGGEVIAPRPPDKPLPELGTWRDRVLRRGAA
jgi:hypothetical protein